MGYKVNQQYVYIVQSILTTATHTVSVCYIEKYYEFVKQSRASTFSQPDSNCLK